MSCGKPKNYPTALPPWETIFWLTNRDKGEKERRVDIHQGLGKG
jgi:hypothetical protein